MCILWERTTFARASLLQEGSLLHEGHFCTRGHFCTATLLHGGSATKKGNNLTLLDSAEYCDVIADKWTPMTSWLLRETVCS